MLVFGSTFCWYWYTAHAYRITSEIRSIIRIPPQIFINLSKCDCLHCSSSSSCLNNTFASEKTLPDANSVSLSTVSFPGVSMTLSLCYAMQKTQRHTQKPANEINETIETILYVFNKITVNLCGTVTSRLNRYAKEMRAPFKI